MARLTQQGRAGLPEAEGMLYLMQTNWGSATLQMGSVHLTDHPQWSQSTTLKTKLGDEERSC